eukprot:scaffold34710_cov208-Amphora_coffeaeformis.AAC.3
MALVNIVNMVVLDNPCNFANPFQFEITFECLQELEEGSCIERRSADAPNPTALPPDDILGVTVVLVTCSYREREFVRVGYYVNNELLGHDPEQPAPSYPQLDMALVQRQILADKPRVTKFPIQWGQEVLPNDENHAQPQQQQQQQQQHVPELHSEDPMEKKMAAAMTGPSAPSTSAMETD